MNSPDMAYAPSSSSDDGSIDASTVPTTPEWSPYLTALQSDSSVRIQNLSRTRVPFTALGLGPAALPVTHEDVAAIRNVCVIGAGYVGEWLNLMTSCAPILMRSCRWTYCCCVGTTQSFSHSHSP